MRPVAVHGSVLDATSLSLRSGARSLGDAAVDVQVLAGRLASPAPGQQAAPAMGLQVAAALSAVAERWEAAARVVALVAASYDVTERRVAALMGAGPVDIGPSRWVGDARRPDSASASPGAPDLTGPHSLLAGLPPGLLEALLVASPALALAVYRTADPDPGAFADRVRAADPPTRRRLALLHPAAYTRLAWAPVRDRFAASRVLLAAALAVERDDRRAAWLAQQLHEEVVLHHPDGTTTRHPHQLLLLDTSDDGSVAEVFGDPDRARHLAVLVPGTGSDLDRYPGTAERAAPFAAAEPGLLVATWVGPDLPDMPLDDPVTRWAPTPGRWFREDLAAAAYRDSAERSGPQLRELVDGLRVALPGPGADTTVLGHSYGGSVVGAAEASGLVVDRVVHLDSAGGHVTAIEDYAAGPGDTRRYSLTPPDDWIRLVQGRDLDDLPDLFAQAAPAVTAPVGPWAAGGVGSAVEALAGLTLPAPDDLGHGLDPDDMPGVVQIAPGSHPDGRPVSGHSGIFEPGSTGWLAVLAVMTGRPVPSPRPNGHLPASRVGSGHWHTSAHGTDDAARVPRRRAGGAHGPRGSGATHPAGVQPGPLPAGGR